MTNEVKIILGAITIDLTNLGVEVTHRYSNPIIAIPTPIYEATPALGYNVVAINVGFVSNTFDVSFTLIDGMGTLDFQTPGSTNYEKLVYLANNYSTKNAKILRINGHDEYGHIENFNCTWKGGQKDLAIGCRLSFRATKNIAMG